MVFKLLKLGSKCTLCSVPQAGAKRRSKTEETEAQMFFTASFLDEVDWVTDEENEAAGMQLIPAHACHINLPLENQFFWVEIRSLEDFAHPLLLKLPFTLVDILK